MMTENEVVDAVAVWLQRHGCTIEKTCKDTARGDDIAAKCKDGSELFVECKGSISRRDNELDSWLNSAMAVFGAIKDIEEKRPNARHAIAIPDTDKYRAAIEPLNKFFVRQKISVLFVHPSGHVRHIGAPNNALQATCEDARA